MSDITIWQSSTLIPWDLCSIGQQDSVSVVYNTDLFIMGGGLIADVGGDFLNTECHIL